MKQHLKNLINYKMSDLKQTNRIEKADSIIKNHMIWSMGAGMIPVPIADIFAVSAIQLDMIKQLANNFDIDFKHTEGKAYIATLTSSSLAKLGARAIKFIPGIGSILGGVTMAALSGGSTYAIGEVFKKHFESGGTFLDFDPERLKKYYLEKFEKGKEMAAEFAKSKEEAKPSEATTTSETSSTEGKSMIDQLKELGGLRDANIITEEEFEALKKKVMGG